MHSCGWIFHEMGQSHPSHPPRGESCSNSLSCAHGTPDIAADAVLVLAKHSWSNTVHLWKLHISTAGLLKLAPGNQPSHYKIPHFLWLCIGGIRNVHAEQLMSLSSRELSWFLILTDNKNETMLNAWHKRLTFPLQIKLHTFLSYL